MAAPSRSDEAGCAYPPCETKVTSQQSAAPRRDAPYMTRSNRRRSSGATPGAVVRDARKNGSQPLAGMRAPLGAQQGSGTRRQAAEEALAT